MGPGWCCTFIADLDMIFIGVEKNKLYMIIYYRLIINDISDRCQLDREIPRHDQTKLTRQEEYTLYHFLLRFPSKNFSILFILVF